MQMESKHPSTEGIWVDDVTSLHNILPILSAIHFIVLGV